MLSPALAAFACADVCVRVCLRNGVHYDARVCVCVDCNARVCVDCNACVCPRAVLPVCACACFDLLAGDARWRWRRRPSRPHFFAAGANAKVWGGGGGESACSLTVLTCILASTMYVHSEIDHTEAALAYEAAKDEVNWRPSRRLLLRLRRRLRRRLQLLLLLCGWC